jgi:hypothetical protein
MKKPSSFLTWRIYYLWFLNWYIFPERHLRAEPAGICVSLNHPGGSPSLFLITYSSCFAGNALDFELSCRRSVAFEQPGVNFSQGLYAK